MHVYRIADSRFPAFDGCGAKLAGGRWNSPGRAVIYAAQTFAGAMLEILVHANIARLPRTYVYVTITIPDQVLVERISRPDHISVEVGDRAATLDYGNRWLEQRRSAVLVVPSVVTGGVETNVLLNPEHPDFELIRASDSKPVLWDSRFFSMK